MISKADAALAAADYALDRAKKIASAMDIETEGPAIRIPVTNMGGGAKFGEKITNESRLFASTREPVGVRMVRDVAVDIFDNWFTVNDTKEDGGDEELNGKVQTVLSQLKVKQVLTRAFIFERRYGTSVILVGYTDGEDLDTPLKEKPQNIFQFAPYPKTKIVKVDEYKKKDIEDESAEEVAKLGYPKMYYINMGDTANPEGVKVHPSRLEHCATRLDEHKYWGISVIDAAYDDMTVFRNERWGMGQTLYRYGSGFPVITLAGAKEKQIQRYYDSGKFKDLCARTYLVKGDDTDFKFAGAEGKALNPQPYYEASLEQMSIASRISKVRLRGAEAGSISGSEVNERNYAAYISGEQSAVESIVRNIIDRLITTGQIETSAENYVIEWISPFEMSEKEKALIDYTQSSAAKNWATVLTLGQIWKKYDFTEGLPSELENMVLPVAQMLTKSQQVQPTSQQLADILNSDEPMESKLSKLLELTEPQNSFGKVMAMFSKDYASKPPIFQIQLVDESLAKISNRFKRGDVTYEEALSEAETALQAHQKKINEKALIDLQNQTGKAISELPPEANLLSINELSSYLDYFKKQLDDIQKQKEQT